MLLSEGHVFAEEYPVATVWSEAMIVRDRHGQKTAQDAIIMQLAVNSVLSPASGKELAKLIKRIQDGG